MTLGTQGSAITNATSSLITTSKRTDTSHVSGKPLLADLANKLNDIDPTIPDRVAISIMENVGVRVDNNDPRLVRLISLAGQKFITDILVDAMTQHKLSSGQSSGLLSVTSTSTNNQQQTTPTVLNSSAASTTPITSSAQETNNTSNTPGSANSVLTTALQSPVKPVSGATNTHQMSKDKRAVPCILTMDDLVKAVKDRGLNIAPPEYYR